jgi:hypothetical protein
MGFLATVSGSYVPVATITTVLREELYDVVTNIDPYNTPVLDMLGSKAISSPVYQWPVDTLPAIVLNNTAGSADVAGVNVQGVSEGFTPDYSAYPYTGAQPSRLTNFIQMFAGLVSISDTLKRGSPSGIRDPYNWEAIKVTRVIKKAIERRLFDNISANSSWVTGTSADPRRMYSLFDWTSSAVAGANYVVTQSTIGATGGIISPAAIDTAMETAVAGSTGAAGGGQPNIVAMSLGVKFDLSAQLRANGNSPSSTALLSPMNWQTISAQEKRVIRNIDVYEGDAGEVSIVWSRQIPQSSATASGGKVWGLQTDMIQFGFYSPIEHIPLAKTGHNTKGIIVGECGYRFLNPKSSFVINNVTT